MNKIRHGDKILIYKHFEGVFFYINIIQRVRFLGTIDNFEQIMVGIELNSKRGNSNGDFEGKSFFKCQNDYGIFLPIDRVIVFIILFIGLFKRNTSKCNYTMFNTSIFS